MSLTVTLPNNYQYVGAALVSTVWLLLVQGIVVSRYRKRAGIKYPQMYAEKAEAEGSKDALMFNCAQRAHQNTLENIPLVFVTYVYIIISMNTDNMILVAQLSRDSSSLCTLRPVVPCGPSLGSLILVGMLLETPKSERPCYIPWALYPCWVNSLLQRLQRETGCMPVFVISCTGSILHIDILPEKEMKYSCKPQCSIDQPCYFVRNHYCPMPKASSRPYLPTSSSDFALPSSSSSPGASTSSITLDDPTFLLQRFRRPSLLQKAGYLSESRLHSPLASSFTLHARRRSQNASIVEESESDKDRMVTDSSSSSETQTPPLRVPGNSEEDLNVKFGVSKLPLTPPRRKSSASMDASDMPTIFNRRLSFPLKQPRILNLLAEARPEDAEVKSEAAFQRLVASCSELPAQPRTPRTFTDRGRYPEEAVREENTQEESPSDDESETEEGQFAFCAISGTQPINIQKPHTPAGSIAGSFNGDDLNMNISEASSSFGAAAMDIDVPGSPLLSSITSSISQWRYTPPPTMSAVRSNKRKLDDRFDPYPATKRRAVSPSLQYLRDSHQTINSSMSRGNVSRLPIAIPITIPASTVSSATSSPTITNTFPSYARGMAITASPTLRATLGMVASPILRPLARRREEEEKEKEIEGAGEAVNGLSLGLEATYRDPSESEATSEPT